MILEFFLVCASISTTAADDFILGGRNTEITERPFQAKLVGEKSFCGASIISSFTLLTAAHCCAKEYVGSLRVYVGTAFHEPDTEPIAVVDCLMYGGYSAVNNHVNDIALVMLASKLTFIDRVQPIALPPADLEVPEGSTGVVSGWGDLEGFNHSVYPPVLQSVEVPVQSHDFCNYHQGYIAPTVICAGFESHGTCSGDSGGPLTWNGFVIGVVSWAFSCGEAYAATVYTRVSIYRPWIDYYIVD